MKDDSLPRRRSVRLPGYDYSRVGGYFVTVCVSRMRCVFGAVDHGSVQLSALGKQIEGCWLSIPQHFPTVTLDDYVIMPNHIHGIVCIECGRDSWQSERFQKPIEGSLATILRSFKSAATRNARAGNLWGPLPLWQRGFYEHIVRPQELATIRNYILNNPRRWQGRLDGAWRP